MPTTQAPAPAAGAAAPLTMPSGRVARPQVDQQVVLAHAGQRNLDAGRSKQLRQQHRHLGPSEGIWGAEAAPVRAPQGNAWPDGYQARIPRLQARIEASPPRVEPDDGYGG